MNFYDLQNFNPLGQWEAQLREHCKGKLEVEVYHGTRDYKVVKLPSADVVLTTYGVGFRYLSSHSDQTLIYYTPDISDY